MTEAGAPLPLSKLHRSLGARFTEIRGREVPAGYGSLAEEYRVLQQGVGALDRSWCGRLQLTGEDRRRFLSGLVTCNLEREPGDGCYGFVTNARGRILTDAVILVLEDRLWVELPVGLEAEIRDHMGKYLVADRVEILPLDTWLPWTVLGARAREVLSDLVDLPDGSWRHLHAQLQGTEVLVMQQGLLGVEAWTVWVPAAEAPRLAEQLLGREGVEPVGLDAVELVRVEAGIPRFGVDFGPAHFPQETSLDEAVDFEKGCYLGQEVVARIHFRGQVNRALRGLELHGEAIPQRGATLLWDGQEVGTLGSAVESPAVGGPIGLAIVHRKAAAPGTQLDIEGYGTAMVRKLPFVGVTSGE